jgi:hypothetical protein
MARTSAFSVSTDVSKRLDITCRKGDTFELTMVVNDAEANAVDFSLFNDMLLQVRPSDDDTGTPVLEFIFPTDFEVSILGTLIIKKSNTDMASIDAGIYVYDLQMTDANSKVVTWFYGIFKINDDVSF